MAWAGLWRVRRTIRGSRKKKKAEKRRPCLQGQPGNKSLRNTRELKPAANSTINAPLKRFQSQF